MCPRPSGPEGVVPLVVSAIVSPALTQTRERSIASSGNLAHRPAAAAMTGENEIAERGCGAGPSRGAVGVQGRQNLREVGVQAAAFNETLCFGARTQRRGNENDIAPAGVDTFAQRSVWKALRVPILVDRLPLDGLGLEAMKIEDEVRGRASRVAVGNEDARNRRRGNSRFVEDFEVDFYIERCADRCGLPPDQPRRRTGARRDRHRRRADRNGRLNFSDANDRKIIRFREAPVGVDSQYFLRHRIVHIAADRDDAPWSNLGHDVTMGFHARSDVLISGGAAGSALAYKIADLRRELADAIGLEGISLLASRLSFAERV